MDKAEISRIRELQGDFFQSGLTQNVEYRICALKLLKSAIKRNEIELCEALREDLGKSEHESYMTEIGMVYDELGYMIRNIRGLSRKRRVHTPIAQFASQSYILPSPRGCSLIMSPWNYPVLLTFSPLIDSIAAGNTAMVKPSAYSPKTSAVIAKIIENCFSEKYIAIVTGGRAENQSLLDENFDIIFFTGSKNVGKYVMNKASENLTPVILELGGKSPCVVDLSANIPLAARRIVFGKFLNCGQTCVAPDYVYCDKVIKDELIQAIKDEIIKQYGEKPLDNKAYGKIISKKHYDRVAKLINTDKVVFGGALNNGTMQIEPTVMDNVSWEDAVMSEEIFGPILPIITYDAVDEAIKTINKQPHPLAFYVFAEEKWVAEAFTTDCLFGGGCINDTIIHLATHSMGFGGVSESGMGSYHGKTGFDSFSHLKSIVDKKTWIDLPIRYQPYNRRKTSVVKWLMK